MYAGMNTIRANCCSSIPIINSNSLDFHHQYIAPNIQFIIIPENFPHFLPILSSLFPYSHLNYLLLFSDYNKCIYSTNLPSFCSYSASGSASASIPSICSLLHSYTHPNYAHSSSSFPPADNSINSDSVSHSNTNSNSSIPSHQHSSLSSPSLRIAPAAKYPKLSNIRYCIITNNSSLLQYKLFSDSTMIFYDNYNNFDNLMLKIMKTKQEFSIHSFLFHIDSTMINTNQLNNNYSTSSSISCHDKCPLLSINKTQSVSFSTSSPSSSIPSNSLIDLQFSFLNSFVCSLFHHSSINYFSTMYSILQTNPLSYSSSIPAQLRSLLPPPSFTANGTSSHWNSPSSSYSSCCSSSSSTAYIDCYYHHNNNCRTSFLHSSIQQIQQLSASICLCQYSSQFVFKLGLSSKYGA